MTERCRANVSYKVIERSARYIVDPWGRKVAIESPSELEFHRRFLIAKTTMEATVACSFCALDSVRLQATGSSERGAFKVVSAKVRKYLQAKCPLDKKFLR